MCDFILYNCLYRIFYLYIALFLTNASGVDTYNHNILSLLGIFWTAKRREKGTSELMRVVELYGRRSLWTEKTCLGITSL